MSEVPQGFVPVVDSSEQEEPPAPALDREALRKGSFAIYRGLREWPSREKKPHRMHVISPRQSPEKKYGLWANVRLDRLLRGVTDGEIVFLRYDGTEPNPQIPDGFIHCWTVARQEGQPRVTEPRGVAELPPEFE